MSVRPGDDPLRLSGLAPTIEQQPRQIGVGFHHPHYALIGTQAHTSRSRQRSYTGVRRPFSWFAVPVPTGAAHHHGFPWLELALSHNRAMRGIETAVNEITATS